MTKIAIKTRPNLVTMNEAYKEKKFLGFGSRLSVPETCASEHLYLSNQKQDGSPNLELLPHGSSDETKTFDDNSIFFKVALDNFSYTPVFTEVLSDNEGNKWDMEIRGQIRVHDSRKFLRAFAVKKTSVKVPLSLSMTESWVIKRLRSRIQDECKKYTIEDLRDKDALPTDWWQKQHIDWVDEIGIEILIDDVSWSSADADVSVSIKIRESELEKIAKAKEIEEEAQLQEYSSKVEFENMKAVIENSKTITELEQKHQLELIEIQHKKQLIGVEIEIENARRQAAEASVKHELSIARLEDDAKATEQFELKLQKVEEEYKKTLEEKERLKETISTWCHPVYQQELVELFSNKYHAEGSLVHVSKQDLITRDIGISKVNGLPMGSSLRFNFRSEKSGFVTLLNIGTSGAVTILVPNAFASLSDSRVESSREYTVPGPDFLPVEKVGDLQQTGPSGWEHLAVLVSDEPMFPEHVISRACNESPLVKLSNKEISNLFNNLKTLDTNCWSADVLSFLVVD